MSEAELRQLYVELHERIERLELLIEGGEQWLSG